ncbi:MAG: ATP-dependent transcriptional regulator [Rhodobacterales bacterium]|nr:MAG: ATP-dependent transcriptional regulator [Rhodobacterales bacterium]
MRNQLLPIFLLLVGCMPGGIPETATRASRPEPVSSLPPIKNFTSPSPSSPARSNRDIARDFLELTFRLESGRDLPVLTRFETPITVRVTGDPSPTLLPDLARLVRRMQTEARLPISMTNDPNANITVQAVSRADIRRNLPHAACFVVPNISDISQYRAARRSQKSNWGLLRKRERLAVFVPNDASPQEVRDCLHEELAQAVGPLNDLYRLPDSVFNDDNVHTVLTGFDMLILRAYYDPALSNGMTKRQVAARLPAILARLNPRGERAATRRPAPTPRSWIDAIQTALGPGTSHTQRKVAAKKALSIAQSLGWQDHRRAFAHYAMGRLNAASDPDAALSHFRAADHFYATSPSTGLHRAYVSSQLAAHALAQGDGKSTLAMVNRAIPTASRHENAALLSTLMLLRAEALEISGRASEASHVRMDSLGWARYGFGADWAVRAKLREIGSLNPLKGRRGNL